MDSSFHTRIANSSDEQEILELYKRVTLLGGGIAHTFKEITYSYISGFCSKSQTGGIQLITFDTKTNKIIAEIHCYKPDAKIFSHVLGNLTIAVDPNYQGKGIGKELFQSLLNLVKTDMRDIRRIELISRESNKKAIHLYLTLGFKIEGRFEKRIKLPDGGFEADIPMAWINPNYKMEF